MKTFVQYLTESHMGSADWEKHDYKYSNAVVSVITGENETISQLALGDKKAESYVDLEKLQKDRDAVEAFRRADSIAEFNKIAKKFGFSWGKIWKAPFTGYDGEISKNKGNAFESEFRTDFNQYKGDLEKILGPFELAEDPKAVGELNTRRPLTFENGNIYALPRAAKESGNKFEVGKAVSDITLSINKVEDGKIEETHTPVYLSLKYGNKVTFINAGVLKLFPKAAFEEHDSDKITKEGVELLEMFSIDKNQFINTFANYSSNKTKKSSEFVDVTDAIKKNEVFNEFVKSVIGYGYIIVHKIKNQVHYYDLRDAKQLKAFIGECKSAKLYYGGKTNNGKRIDIYMDFESADYKLSLQFNIRSKRGDTYPTHIMSDYVITKK